jgi:uncharacterized iron-regulated protein
MMREVGPTIHPLVGRATFPAAVASSACTIDDVGRWLVETAAPGTAIILGEVHDNPWQHRLRAQIIAEVAATQTARGQTSSPALVFEHIRVDQAPALTAATKANAAAVFAALNWKTSGWPDQSMFAPIIDVALKWDLPIIAGHPTSAAVRNVARSGLDQLAPEDRARLGLDQPLAPALQDDLLGELEASHCGLMPKTAFGNMALAQRFRDAHMASIVTASLADRTTILLTGNGHARTDRGVPSYLPKTVTVVSVLFLEVEDGKNAVTDYGPFNADAVVFTPRADRKDPCDEMRAMMQKKK